ncbi:hypothetical protein DXG01_014381 [Tephrocybe rancida]|nr:hypothetical protein DXG01_014381 [Tephrocybe rancida]
MSTSSDLELIMPLLMKYSQQIQTPGDASHASAARPEKQVLPKAFYDKRDDVYHCIECDWEVVDGACHSCGEKYTYLQDGMPDPDPCFNNVDPTADTDHVPYPRSSTPLLTNLPVAEPLAGYSSSELITLMQRGATRLMIEKYSLKYSHECGIFACADEDLYEEFAGPQMGPRDRWKIQLGRRIQLEDTEHDGTRFIESVLEGAILYPGNTEWETALTRTRVWITRIKEDGDDDLGAHDSHGQDEDVGDRDHEPEQSNEVISLEENEVEVGYKAGADGEDGNDDENGDDSDNELASVSYIEDDHKSFKAQDDCPLPADDGPVLKRPDYDFSDEMFDDSNDESSSGESEFEYAAPDEPQPSGLEEEEEEGDVQAEDEEEEEDEDKEEENDGEQGQEDKEE